MNHPSELLAEYVDGTLPERERAVVDAHLGTCEACRQEVAAARGAREALRGLPPPAAPPGLARDALAAAARPGPSAGRWQRVAGLAAAAVLVGLVAIAVPRLLADEDSGSAAAESADSMAAAPATGLERLQGQLEPQDLQRLAESETAPTTAAAEDAAGGDGGTDRGAEQALRCLGKAYPDIREANPIRVAEATFEETPAYVGVFERGPGAGQPPDTRIALAVASADCSILSFSSASI
jgi:hypothetical protein